MSDAKIVYTHTDEAPMLATYSLLPILQAFTDRAGVIFEISDISLAGRILAQFPDRLGDDQRVPDALAELGDYVKQPDANLIKLPNISASIPQLTAAIRELREQGYDLPDYPAEPQSDAEREIKARYAKVLGSAVNPVLREGNSDRRVAPPVKEYARKNPHSMGAWSSDSKSHVASMSEGDFFGNERSVTIAADTAARVEFVAADGSTTVLKESIPLLAGEVFDATCMSAAELRAFLEREIADAKAQGVLCSIHLKATMMKVSDPIIFGHMVRAFFAPVFERHGAALERVGVNPNNGLGDLEARIAELPDDERRAIEASIAECYDQGPELAMVNSDKGITNLHVPSDVIIDASMPAMIRSSGQMWGPDGDTEDTKAIIPDRCYAGVYQETIAHCKAHGAFDPTTMGSVANVGLMAKKAEEYGSHDKTFEAPGAGHIRVIDAGGTTLFEHAVGAGDIWRACQTKDVAIRDWVRLAVERARDTGAPAIFWLDAERAHDSELIKKVEAYLGEHDTDGLDIRVLPPIEATRVSLERCRAGEDTISVTGNVLRDYLTDLFPILELGTSAKMLSIVPLLAGGGLYETGAGGSAPKHVQQFVEEGHLRWDSVGEFLALAVALGDLGRKHDKPKATQLGEALNLAIGRYLDERKAPSRKVGELDNRGSHYFLARYWAEAMAEQGDEAYAAFAKELAEHEATILAEIDATQGQPQDLGGYYQPDDAKATAAMRPSQTLNQLLAGLVEA